MNRSRNKSNAASAPVVWPGLGKIVLSFVLVAALPGAGFSQDESARYRRIFEIVPGREYDIDLHIDAGEVTVEPNDQNREISISLRYTRRYFSYDFDFDEGARSLRIDFEKQSWLKGDSDNLDAAITVAVPVEAIFSIRGRIKAGEVAMNLGGLAINRFDIRTWAGEVRVRFDEPNRLPMSEFHINTKVGETRLKKLGNARFRRAEINSGIGALDVDFSGELEDDAIAEIDLDIGESDISFPRDIAVRLAVNKFLFLSSVQLPPDFERSGKFYLSPNYSDKQKKLEVDIRSGIGELNVAYR